MTISRFPLLFLHDLRSSLILYIQSVEFKFRKSEVFLAVSGMASVHLLLLLICIYLIIFVSCHPSRPAPDPEITPPMQCLGWCLAKCLAEHADKNLAACQSDCRPYGQISLCNGPEKSKRKKRSTVSTDSDSNEHRAKKPKPPKNAECWKRCRNLGHMGEQKPPRLPPPLPRDLKVSLNENFTIDIEWKPGPGPEGEKVSLYLIQLEANSPNHQITQIFSQTLSFSGLAPPSPENLCGPMSVQVAAINEAKGFGHFSKPVRLEERAPQVPARMELFSAKYNSTPFMTDEYEVNGTLDVELHFELNGWPFGIEDLEVGPMFHLLGCAIPDLSQAMPAPEFHHGTKPDTVMTHMGADMMYRRCRFVFAVEEVRSSKCGREYSIAAGQKDFQSVEFNCDTVEDANLAPDAVCARQKKSLPPVCGQFDKFNYSLIEEQIDPKTKKEALSVNITFEPFQRILSMKPKYYVALYGHAIKFSNEDEKFFGGVNMTDVVGNMTNCAEFAADGSCKRFYSNNSIVLDGLKRSTNYGVLLCAVMDPRNMSFPSVNTTNKSLKPRAFELYIPTKGHHAGHEHEEEEEEEHREEKKHFVKFLVAGAVLLCALLIGAVVAAFCWIRHQKKELKEKRLNFEAMRRQREQRYTDFPARREEPWELERRNVIIYEDKKLGSGAFGSVYLGKLVGINRLKGTAANQLNIGLLRAENALVAVKMLPEYADDLSKSEFLREIGLMKTLGYHERLVNMLACVTQSEPYCLIVEYCSDGDLLQYLRARCKYMLQLDDAGVNYSDPDCDADFDRAMIMTVKQLLMFAVQISYGLEYLSQKGFVHRDVAARNILVSEKTHAKIGDFGLCRFIYSDAANYKGRGGRLPIKWMSPEAIRHYEFTTSSDVWSFGVLMFEIITLGGTPYPGIQPDDMLTFLESGQRIAQPDNCPDEYYKVMCACWAPDPRIRPDFGAIRQQLALQLENVSDEYAYLKLDAKKDYYNVSYGELKAQRGEEVEERNRGQQKNGKEEKEEEEEADDGKKKLEDEQEVEQMKKADVSLVLVEGQSGMEERPTMNGFENINRPFS